LILLDITPGIAVASPPAVPRNDATVGDDTHELCRDILSFLLDNPRGQDTLVGIAEWWLMEREIRREVTRVERALSRLVADGLLVEKTGADGTVRYALNVGCMDEIRRRVEGAQA
jgi:hypothetical protein